MVPKGDFIKLNINELNFNKNVRGRKDDNIEVIPAILTKREVSEVLHPLGKVAPILGV